MNDTERERARIRALAVMRMNLFMQSEQESRDNDAPDSAHAWTLAMKGMRGLIAEIDSGETAADIRKRAQS